MATFEKSFTKTVKAEGGYVNDPNDAGGETYMGVTRKYHPNLAMWNKIDKYKKSLSKKELNKVLKEDEQVQKDVRSVYWNSYWKPLRLDEVNSQLIANQFFDNAINCGVTATIKLMQKIKLMKVTGKMSNELIKKYGKAIRRKS